LKSDSITAYIDSLQARGKYSFTKTGVKQATGKSDQLVKLSLWRIAQKKRIAQVREGFYLIVPIEYTSSGILPPDWFIADLMKYLDLPYYVGLMSAAALHGAAHQQPQEFQVVTSGPIRKISIGRLSIAFFTKAGLRSSVTEQIKTSTGYMNVSTPALTALDLVAYAGRIGGLSRALTVLKELAEKITAQMLLDAAKREKRLAIVQRLGWLLTESGHGSLCQPIAEWIKKQRARETPLDPSLPRKGFSRDPVWKVIVNTDVKSDI